MSNKTDSVVVINLSTPVLARDGSPIPADAGGAPQSLAAWLIVALDEAQEIMANGQPGISSHKELTERIKLADKLAECTEGPVSMSKAEHNLLAKVVSSHYLSRVATCILRAMRPEEPAKEAAE